MERETSEPNSDGTFAEQAVITDMPEDLRQQLKVFLKAISKVENGAIPDKRKRDEAQSAVITKVLQDLEARYATSVLEDQRLLSTSNVGRRQKMAIEVRLGEKKLLQEAKAFLASVGEDEYESSPQKRTKMSG